MTWPRWLASPGQASPPRAVERLHEHSGGLALYVRTLLAELSVSQLAAPGGSFRFPGRWRR